jgi:hypothetical protein
MRNVHLTGSSQMGWAICRDSKPDIVLHTVKEIVFIISLWRIRSRDHAGLCKAHRAISRVQANGAAYTA